MSTYILDKTQVNDLILQNKYPVDQSRKFISRCIDGRYEYIVGLPALALPGGELGQLAIIYAAANDYGFVIDHEKVFMVVCEVIGGIKNFSVHSDTNTYSLKTGCGHAKALHSNPSAYSLTEKDISLLDTQISYVAEHGARETVVHGDHHEGAMITIRGSYGVYPRYDIDVGGIIRTIETFVFHQSLVDERHKVIAKKLVEEGAVTLVEGCDEEYLYTVLTEMTDVHLLETAKCLAKGLPMYAVVFKNEGAFDLEDLDIIQ